VAHFRHVADRSPVPVVVYNIPYRTGRGLGAAALLELAACDNVIGVKQAVGGVDADTLTVLAGSPEGFAVLGGDDPYLFPVPGGADGRCVPSPRPLISRQKASWPLELVVEAHGTAAMCAARSLLAR
jgi:dihydrodipicolinate synthase/N-acetylneuraminate lyase